MEVIILFIIICAFYQMFWGIPKQIQQMDEKIEMLKFHFKEVNLKLDQVSEKLNENSK